MASKDVSTSEHDTKSTSKQNSASEIHEVLSDYHDLGLVEILHKESNDIFEILKLKNTSKDKITYTAFSLNIFLTCFLVGFVPNYFYIWHTAKAVILLTYRWYAYKKQRYHYFLFDLCYFCNFLVLVYLWLPEQVLGPAIRGKLFATCFAFANGPVLSAIVMWRNSLVPHSTDKMTSLFIHVSPSLTLFGLRWFSTPEQRFLLCSKQPGFLISECSDVSAMEILYYPMLMYMAWQITYGLIVDVACREKVEKQEYATSYKYIVEKSEGSMMVQLFSVFGPKYRKPVYIASQFIYTLLSVHLAYFCYSYMVVNVLAVIVVMGVASYNGATFYIDVFSHKYKSSQSKSN